MQQKLPKRFEQTSDALYDRHHYKLVYSNKKFKIFESWEELRYAWFETPFALHVEVLDIKTKQKSKGGF